MGNCQAVEGAAVVIQHPGGKIERLYWPTTAEDVMRSNPGHHVALVTLCIARENNTQINSCTQGVSHHLRFTRVRLLKPKDVLLVGQIYRLVTSQDVKKAVKDRKLEKMKRNQSESVKKQMEVVLGIDTAKVGSSMEASDGAREVESPRMADQVEKQERDGQKKNAINSNARARHWRPTLQSISEAVS